jgi:signal transduction histidine kinase
MNDSAMKINSRVLLISNDFHLQEICRGALKRGDFSIQVVLSLFEGIEKARQESFDLLLLDWEVIRGRGNLSLLQKLWEKDPNFACLLITKPDSLLEVFQLEVYEILSIPMAPKNILSIPMIPEHLVSQVAQALGTRISYFDLKRLQLESFKKAVNCVLEKRNHSLELVRLQVFEKSIAPLWATAKGEMETSDLLDKYFLAPAAFRLTIAHEFRAPITALQSFLLILLKGYVAPDKWKEMIAHAYDRSQELLDLVDDLMNLVTARQEMSYENCCLVHINEALEKLIPSFKAEAEQRGLTLTLAIGQNPSVMMNAFHAGHLWSNLISNAIKYTPAGGHVQISLEKDEAWAIGSVEDSGIGISSQEVPLIFHEFYRSAEAKKMGVRGTGLGLPLVKKIVEGYRGTVEVKSTVGEGSLFRFRLPLAKPPARQEHESGGGGAAPP